MALSDWDTLAFDQDGNACAGIIKGADGANVEIYKNWLYVRDPQTWTPESQFVEPTVANVNDGTVDIAGFHIEASRHSEQQAIFALIVHSDSNEPRWMAGIGCSGYSDPTEAIARAAKVDLGKWEEIRYGSRHGPNGNFHMLYCFSGDRMQEFQVPWNDDLEAQWIGVLPETRDAFFAWLEDKVRDGGDGGPNRAWLAKCRENGGLRFNQGDMFFANAVGVEAAEIATRVGEAADPILMQMIQRGAPPD